ncbi:hypothetical protein E2K98_14635 [Bacillus salipaludis]|uniref:Uncharacterized protein n=1 Tax=Bacillus salipaludis TaxID=2547811 RepID=A0A4R5VQS6_9BACI|nr:hypothetical protein [Bacillus salipaludis]TDK60948.1 hypothetical protein E2K98_14635 [Bacillus salipaludis]
MKPPLKYSIYSILYFSDNGIWEYEIYQALKEHYNIRSLSKIRSILLELSNKSWTDEVEVVIHNNSILRKYRLQERHKEFVKYQLTPHKIIEELGLRKENVTENIGRDTAWGPSL